MIEKCLESVIHSIGVSNYEIRHLEEMKRYATRVTVPAVNQVEFHPHFRRKELKEYCENKGIFLQVLITMVQTSLFMF